MHYLLVKTDVNLFFYDSNLSDCPFPLVDASHKLEIHVSVHLSTIKISLWARDNFYSFRKIRPRVLSS